MLAIHGDSAFISVNVHLHDKKYVLTAVQGWAHVKFRFAFRTASCFEILSFSSSFRNRKTQVGMLHLFRTFQQFRMWASTTGEW